MEEGLVCLEKECLGREVESCQEAAAEAEAAEAEEDFHEKCPFVKKEKVHSHSALTVFLKRKKVS